MLRSVLASGVWVDGSVAEGAVLTHGHVLFGRPVMAGEAGPGRAEVHQRPARHHTDGEPGVAARADAAPVRDHRLAARALTPVRPRVLWAVLDKDVHGKLLVLLLFHGEEFIALGFYLLLVLLGAQLGIQLLNFCL